VRITIVHPYLVHAGAVGGTTRVFRLVRYLAERHSVEVLTHASGDPAADRAAAAELAGFGVSHRTFARPRATARRKVSWMLSPEPYFVGHNWNPALAAYLGERDRAGELDVVHVEFAYLAPHLARLGPRPARILAEQETMSLMIERLRAVPRTFLSAYQLYIARELHAVRRFERTVLPRFDRAFAITPTEAAIFGAILGRHASVLPHVVDAKGFSPPEQEPAWPTCLFVGNFTHDPNRHALRWLLDEVWPSVRRQLPSVRLEVVGPGVLAEDRSVAEREGATVLGHVENLAACYRRASVFLNPIRSGGGMRGKVLEAFASGRPVVSTWLGMEGIAAADGVQFDAADDPADFAAAVRRLLDDPALRRARGEQARRLVEERYDAPRVFSRLEAAYAAAVAERRAGADERVA
jgi:glycosyltransferase involved in cell wall biosynthesis